jgi:hypothetical protein
MSLANKIHRQFRNVLLGQSDLPLFKDVPLHFLQSEVSV